MPALIQKEVHADSISQSSEGHMSSTALRIRDADAGMVESDCFTQQLRFPPVKRSFAQVKMQPVHHKMRI